MLKPIEVSAAEIADRLTLESELLYERCIIRGRSLWSVWQSYNDQNNPLRDKALPFNRGASVINLLAQSALHETIMIITRALDGAGRGGVFKTNRVSFPVLLELSKVPGVRQEVAKRARRWFPDDPNAEVNAATVLDEIDLLQQSVERLGAEMPNRARRLRDFRDEFLAHNLTFEEERDRPVISDVTDMLEEITLLTEHALLAFSGSSIDWENLDQTSRENAEVLWNVIRDGVT